MNTSAFSKEYCNYNLASVRCAFQRTPPFNFAFLSSQPKKYTVNEGIMIR